MRISRLALAILSTGLATTASAGGFALNEQSVSAMGTANAGRASNAEDASVVYGNPAAMVQLKRAQFTQALAFIDASTKIKNTSGGLPGGTNNGDIVPHTYVPSGFFTSGDKGGWAWGAGLYGSFGLKTNYEDSFAGRYLGDKSSVKITTFQPVLSYRINDSISIGGGPTINRLDALLSKDTTAAAFGKVTLEGDDMGYGYNVGVHARLAPATQAGLVYRSKVRYKINDGTLTATAGAPGTYTASTSLDTPESVELGLTHRLSPKLSVHATASWTRWSRLKDLTVASNAPGPLANSTEVFNWKDSTAYSVGLTHDCSDKLELRAGLGFDNSPVAPEDRSVRLPSADRRFASVGAGYKLSANQRIDASYLYLREENAAVHRPAAAPFPPYNADYRNSANLFGLQFTQKF